MTSPIEPGRIPGQNPETPERLPGHTHDLSGYRYGAAVVYGLIGLALLVVLVFALSNASRAAESSTPVSDVMQTVAYFGGAVLLGIAIVYGMMHSRSRGPSSNQNAATKRVYEEEEKDRKQKELAAEKSSNPIDVVERKTDTTG